MKLTIVVKARCIRIESTIDTSGESLSAQETRHLRDELASRLMKAVVGLPFLDIPLSRVVVR